MAKGVGNLGVCRTSSLAGSMSATQLADLARLSCKSDSAVSAAQQATPKQQRVKLGRGPDGQGRGGGVGKGGWA